MTDEVVHQNHRPLPGGSPSIGRGVLSPPMLSRIPHLPVAALLAMAAVVGMLLVRTYGVSWDEVDNVAVGEAARRAYAGSKDYFALPGLVEHGPLYFMIFTATSETIHRILPLWSLADGRHMTTYATFLFGALSFYVICLRLLSRKSALMATVLFATQPILFGSAFVNQKDIPFMTFFLAVIASGLVGVDGWEAFSGKHPGQPPEGLRIALRRFTKRVGADWRGLHESTKSHFVVLLTLGTLIIVDLFLVGLLQHLGEWGVKAAYNRHALWPIQRLFDLIAVDAYKTPLQLYIEKFGSLFSLLRLGISALLVLVAIVFASASLESIGALWMGAWSNGRYPYWLGSAVFLGGAICIRQVGVLAGAILTLYMLYRGRMKAVLPLLLFWLVAASVAYLTWPYLWADPVRRILDSFSKVDAYGLHTAVFRGRVVFTSELPWNYFPEFLSLQLTEPALILAGVGFPVLVWKSLKRESDPLVVGLLAGWIGAPTYWLIFRGAGIYGGIRHLLFVLPPILILAGAGIDLILDLVSRPWLRRVILSLILIPGLWGIISLQPYEYTYFNIFAGGVDGAYGRYSQDYWCTSIKEGTETVNRMAGPAQALMIFGQVQNAIPYARSDLQIESQYSPLWKADFVVLCKDVRSARWDPGDFRLVSEVRRGGAVYAEVWERVRPAVPNRES